MSDSDQTSLPERLTDLLDAGTHEETVACLNRLGSADAETRKRSLRAVRHEAETCQSVFDGLATPLASFLTDDDRAVRLTTAKLFVTLARVEPTVVQPVADSLSERLGDDEEFYYVRARCAEALGYVAVESPEEVTDPETIADLRVGLSFDEPEVKEKLAKALSYVALGDPGRLRHQVGSLADHLNDDNELVRYHLCTALVVVGCEVPAKVADATDALRERLADESPYVRGRAAEALGVVVESDVVGVSLDVDSTDTDEETPSFLSDRLCYLRGQVDDWQSVHSPAGVGTIESVRHGTENVVGEMTSPNGGECPHCGLALAENGPPMCPRCGAPC